MKNEIDLKIPDMGQSGVIQLVAWKINAGDNFVEGDEICDLITDKAAFSLEAPSSGKLLIQLLGSGEIVVPGQIIGKALLDKPS